MTTPEDLLAKVREIHQVDHHYRCGARTTETVEHYSGGMSETNLVCTEAPGHEGLHKDAICCWRSHKFEAPTPAEPEDTYAGRYVCTCGRYECQTLRVLEGADQ